MQKNSIMLHWITEEPKNKNKSEKNTVLDKTRAIKKTDPVSLKVLDVKYLFHLRLDFFVKQQNMMETEWHLARLKALINADERNIVTVKNKHLHKHT